MTKAVNLATIGSNATSTGTLLTAGTLVTTTSGTAATFSSIPSWVKRITVMFNSTSTNSSNYVQIQVGSGGTLQSTGYTGTLGCIYGSAAVSQAQPTTAWQVFNKSATSDVQTGTAVLTLVTGNTWVLSGATASVGASYRNNIFGGTVTLSGALNILAVADTSGAAFTAGSINILYE